MLGAIVKVMKTTIGLINSQDCSSSIYNFFTCRISMHGHCHDFPCLNEFSSVVPSCFTLSSWTNCRDVFAHTRRVCVQCRGSENVITRLPHSYLHQVFLTSVQHDFSPLSCLRRLETLLLAGAQPRTTHHLWPRRERGRKRSSARRSCLKGRVRAVVNQTSTGTFFFYGNRWKTSELRAGAHMGFPERVDTILTWAWGSGGE